MNSSSRPCSRFTRRAFVLGAGLGLAAGVPGTVLGFKRFLHSRQGAAALPVQAAPADGMPGKFPGRVVEIQHPDSVRTDWSINPQAVSAMVDRGMRELAGGGEARDLWRSLFQTGDVVGIKVNPVGHRQGKPQSISSHALIVKIVEELKAAGVKPRDIVLFERYGKAFYEAGYDDLCRTRPLAGVRWHAASWEYSDASAGDGQLSIEGYDGQWVRAKYGDPHILGYDPDVFTHLGYTDPGYSKNDDRRFRSHLSLVVSRLVNKVINLPVLKDHGSAGVTLALKNMSHGFFNNVARSHLPRVARGDALSGPNQCNTFIPHVLLEPRVRQKVVLHILDGLIGVWQGGPSSTSGCVWPHKALFFATDPVAMDRVGWEIVDAKRVEQGLPVVARAGYQVDPSSKEYFDRRQPEHIILSGTIGLGQFQNVEHRRVRV